MSKKVLTDTFQPKVTRNDRFAQMTHQEKVIEQKKREILAKLEAKQKAKSIESNKATANVKPNSSPKKEDVKKLNVFTNDGSFLDQFKQMKEKRFESKAKPKSKESEKSASENKNNRWSQRRKSPLEEHSNKRNQRFDKSNYEPKITINSSFNNLSNINYEESVPVSPQNVTGQPLLKNMISNVNMFNNVSTSESVIAAPPVLLNMPPPQIVQGGLNNVLLSQAPPNILVSAANNVQLTPVLKSVSMPPPPILPPPPPTNTSVPAPLPIPPPCIQQVELANIPPPNPIQVQNIPQPEPLNAMNIPHPAPIQVQNIPTPTSIQLSEIPNPKPLDLMAIPTPKEEKSIPDSNYIKNVPPPNKSVPPPPIVEPLVQNMQTLPPPPQNMMVNVPPPIQNIQISLGVNSGGIPSLMAQPILPPPGMGVAGVNVNCPPPLLGMPPGNVMHQPPPGASFVNQPPPQMPPMNIPPPTAGVMTPFKDLNTAVPRALIVIACEVFPPGTADFETMASLGRMVAQCGPGIEDEVRQRKNQDPSLWFLFQKDSAAYQQYLQLVEQFKQELAQENAKTIKPEDIYDPEASLEENDPEPTKTEVEPSCKRKRKSRWGDKDPTVASPLVAYPVSDKNAPSNLMLSQTQRSDPALIQYVLSTYGSTNISEEDWKKAEDNFKINMLYQDMIRKRDERERLKQQGKNKYEYDSDEETEGGTWEHKLREKEMIATQLWAQELNRQAEGKHHIGDFLPPEELKKLLMKSSTGMGKDERENFSDYNEMKIKEDNIGFKMLQKLGWSEGQGLGQNGAGIVEPINKAASRDQNQGLGLGQSEENEDEYESYRKRMMLAYRFRPNPLNNPRRPYY